MDFVKVKNGKKDNVIVTLLCNDCGRYFDVCMSEHQYELLVNNKGSVGKVLNNFTDEEKDSIVLSYCPECLKKLKETIYNELN